VGLYLRASATAEIGFAVLAKAVPSFVSSALRTEDTSGQRQPVPRIAKACTSGVLVLLAVCVTLGRSAQVPPHKYFTLTFTTGALIALQIS
jgi:hypothetical protein